MFYNLPADGDYQMEEATLAAGTLLEITDSPIVPEEVISRVGWDDCGALVTFTGRVRDYSGSSRVLSLEHAAGKETAETLLTDIDSEMRQRWDLGEVAFCYRTGPVPAGGITLVIAVASRHRPEAFAACQYAIDRFKQSVSAKEILEDG
jgi:molybdopterin synthase catalytic subunit